ncbi:MAG: GSU2403 family nucleotidyltransferase fold protein [Noviherbaspirillum sp.]
MVVSASGRMALMQTIDPVIFVDFKRWVASEAPERPALKRRRDANQAAIVEALLNEGLLMF